MFDFRVLLRKKVMFWISTNFPFCVPNRFHLTNTMSSNYAKKKNCPFYVDAQSLVAIMESLVTPTREWLVPVHIARSQRLGETYDIYLKCFSLLYCMVGMI